MGEALVEILIRGLVWLVLLPLLLVGSTPVILVRGLFGEGRYWQKVKRDYSRVLSLWGHLGNWVP